MTTVIQPWSIAAAFAVAAVVGFASGSYPAYKATLIDPIAALRNDWRLSSPAASARAAPLPERSWRSAGARLTAS
jgi:hypothetical protein